MNNIDMLIKAALDTTATATGIGGAALIGSGIQNGVRANSMGKTLLTHTYRHKRDLGSSDQFRAHIRSLINQKRLPKVTLKDSIANVANHTRVEDGIKSLKGKSKIKLGLGAALLAASAIKGLSND